MDVGIVLAGGMAKGAYQVGALRAIAEYYEPEDVKYISAASVGALNAYAYAAGKMDYAYKLWRGLFKCSDKIFLTSVLKSDYLRSAMDKLTDLRVKCQKIYAPVFNLRTRCNYYTDLLGQSKERAVDLLRAAVAFFPFCKPVKIDDKYYCDGAIIDDIPVFPLLKHRLDYVICVYYDEYNYMFESDYFDNKIIKISLYNREEVLKQSLWFTKEDTERMFEEGYRKTKAVLDFVFSKGMDSVETIYSQIEMLNSLNPKKQIRLTGDVVVGRINSVGKTLSKRKIVD